VIVALSLMLAAGAGQANREATVSRAGPMIRVRDSEPASPGVSRLVLAEFTRCVVRRKPDVAKKAVLDPEVNPAEDRKSGLGISDCMPPGARMRAPAVQVRYGLAEALSLSEADDLSLDFAGVGPLEHRPFTDRPMPAEVAADPRRVARWNAFAAQAHAFAALSPFGECVVRAAPAQSLAVLRTAVESKAETAALNALGPVLAPCLARGRALQLNKLAMRGTLALNLYRLAHAPRIAAVSGGGK
jgi:hypothetical protein